MKSEMEIEAVMETMQSAEKKTNGLSSNNINNVWCDLGTRLDQINRKKIFKDADFWYHKGISSDKKGKTETAIECYKQALKLVIVERL
jgi:hypothetical protein